MTKPDMPEELKPCPFCGGEAEFLNSLQTVQKVFLNHDTGCIANVVRYFSSKEDAINAWNTRADQSPPVTGETSDGYHTFNELYEHRHILFLSVLCANKDRAWRSKLHADGTMFDGWFIAGLNTEIGAATYHLPERMWCLFDQIKTLDKAPEFDGHTAGDTLVRLREHAIYQSPPLPDEVMEAVEAAAKEAGMCKSNGCNANISLKHLETLIRAATQQPEVVTRPDITEWNNHRRIQSLMEMGFTHRMENGDHVVEGHGIVLRHTSLFCLMSRVVPNINGIKIVEG
jgi:hypothetical protein